MELLTILTGRNDRWREQGQPIVTTLEINESIILIACQLEAQGRSAVCICQENSCAGACRGYQQSLHCPEPLLDKLRSMKASGNLVRLMSSCNPMLLWVFRQEGRLARCPLPFQRGPHPWGPKQAPASLPGRLRLLWKLLPGSPSRPRMLSTRWCVPVTAHDPAMSPSNSKQHPSRTLDRRLQCSL